MERTPFLIKIKKSDPLDFTIIKGRDLIFKIFEDETTIILGYGLSINIQLIKSELYNSKNKSETFKKIAGKISKGVLFYVDKNEKQIETYSDVFGYTSLFFSSNPKYFFLSNSFSELTFRPTNFSQEAILDLFLFHHLTSGSTPVKEIKRLKGGHKLIIQQSGLNQAPSQSVVYHFQSIFDPAIHKIENAADFLHSEIESNLNFKLPIFLTLTGGFDSRALLAVMSKSNYNFETITWGAEGNLQNIVSKEVSNQFGIKHNDLFLSKHFLENIGKLSQRVIKLNPDNPMLLDMPQFVYLGDSFPGSNLITGFMGSEIIRGPTISSQTTFTAVAAQLALSNSLDEFGDKLSNFLTSTELFNHDSLKSILPGYLNKFKHYFRNGSYIGQRALEFLFYEKFARLYGSIENLHHDSQKIINPYLNQDFISTILNSKSSILNYDIFKTSAFDHFIFYKTYANIIKHSNPLVLNSKVDRGYRVKDLIRFTGYPYLLYAHLKKRTGTKINYPKTLDYSEWMKDMIQKDLENSYLFEIPLFIKESLIKLLFDYRNSRNPDSLIYRKLIVLLGINYWTEK